MPQALDPVAQRPPAWYFVVRIVFGSLILISSVYGVLAYMPDTYFAFIQAPFRQGLPVLMRLQPFLLLALIAGIGVSLCNLGPTAKDKRIAALFLLVNTGFALWMIMAAPFANLRNDSRSFIWSIVILFPLLWEAIADIYRDFSAVQWRSPSAGALRLWPATALGIWIGFLIPGAGYLRYLSNGQPPHLGIKDYIVWAWAIVSHVCFFVGLIAIVNLVRGLSTRSRNVSASRFVMFGCLAFVGVRLLFAKVIEPAVPFGGTEASVYATAASVAIVAWVAALRLLWLRRSEAISVLSEPRRRQKMITAVLLFSAAFAFTAPAFIGLMDWNGILEKLSAVFVWAFLWWVLIPLWPVRERVIVSRSLGWMILAAAVYCAGLWVQDHHLSLGFKSEQAMQETFGRHAFMDPSLQVITQTLSIENSVRCNELCEFLTQQTNIPASMEVKAANIGLVHDLKPTQSPRPNVFVFVIDSLRQDYVSAYNPAVDFTPELGKFAAESVVMRNAFTRYAGTTLSEPSIWTGTMLLHKHFVQPFHPLNNLEKVLDVDGYRKFITVDTTLRVLLQPSANTIPLDENIKTWTEVDLCTTVQDFESTLDATKQRSSPIFLYTQSQNIHIISISNHASRIHPQRSYGSFDPLIATELQRLDGCFGGFVRYLKSKGLYDHSVIVVTADHGEAVNEVGHRLHALAMHPEILRVPLIIHLPQTLRSELYTDPNKAAFTIDVTPTLFYLLGHRPIISAPELGRPLFTASKQEHDSYLRDDYLVVSSYGPIFGLLSQNGSKLFVDNLIEHKRQYFDLASDSGGRNNLITTELAATQEAIVRKHVQNIADEYHFQYRRPTLLDWAMR